MITKEQLDKIFKTRDFQPGYCDWCEKEIPNPKEDNVHFLGTMILDINCRNLMVKLGLEYMKEDYGLK